MNIKFRNLLLIGSIATSIIFTSCKKDDDNKSSNTTSGNAPIANFVASQTNIEEGTSITFTDNSTNIPTTWSWDFGDGNTSTEQNPSHIYNTEGSYSVSLTANNTYGSDTETKTDYITVDTVSTTNETGTFIDNRDGKTYKWVKIGNQVWMAENLAFTDSGQQITDNTAWENNTSYNGWCYYDNNSSNGTIYGVLYQWEVAKTACPNGWHLPTDDEWTTLINYLGGTDIAGGKMKETGTTHWVSPNTGADNSSGFSALPSGLCYSDGTFNHLYNASFYWSNTEIYSNNVYSYYLYYENTKATRYNYDKSYGFSVRCIRD